MIRKLVELDENLAFKEVDKKKIKRTGKKLLSWLLAIDPANDPYEFRRFDLPIVLAALDDSLQFPHKGQQPHNWEIREGLLSDEYLDLASPFYNAIRGAHYCPPEIIQRGDKKYAWTFFETDEDF
ncbi:hypothetical protein VARIO8X_130128 [Burkholderiales bacterium 8X]|nr:hypothetical protein VARIO8X_130128 [Burkholderiales bacterium 8X]